MSEPVLAITRSQIKELLGAAFLAGYCTDRDGEQCDVARLEHVQAEFEKFFAQSTLATKESHARE
ncbi:MAG TPA: hypothetical protein VGQ69_04785 [Gemmatimonadales bacterium]|jgi:hypothetical protein|nr:hypothetical protein [Gemmatimonadales bacterium]